MFPDGSFKTILAICFRYSKTFPPSASVGPINMLVAAKFIRSLVEKYGRHAIYTDGGTWYYEAYNILKLKHYLHSSFEKSLMERVNQYFKDRTESFDDYYPCVKNECNLFHVHSLFSKSIQSKMQSYFSRKF